MNNHHTSQWVLATLLIIFGFALRLIPHPANVAPIGAIAMFSALYLPRRIALIMPLGIMLISDLFIGFYTWQILLSVYASFVLVGLIGFWVRKHKAFFTVVGGTVLGSAAFFLITNGAVWAFSGMYPPTFAGLLQSYFMGLPFFRNTLFGDLLYVGFLVGGFETIQYFLRSFLEFKQTKGGKGWKFPVGIF